MLCQYQPLSAEEAPLNELERHWVVVTWLLFLPWVGRVGMITPWRSESGFLSWFPYRLQEPAKNINERMQMLGKRKALFIRINEETSQDSFQVSKVPKRRTQQKPTCIVVTVVARCILVRTVSSVTKSFLVSICCGGNYCFTWKQGLLFS